MKRLVLGCMVLVVFLSILTGDAFAVAPNPYADFLRGNQFYREGDYQRALETYSELVKRGESNFELFFNLGNVHYRLGHIGQAVYWWDRASRLRPRDEDVRINLDAAARAKLDRFTEAPDPIFLLQKRLDRFFSLREAQISLLLAWGGLIVILVTGRLKNVFRCRGYRMVRNFAVVLLLASSAMLGWKLFFGSAYRQAVVTTESLDLLSEPRGTSEQVTTIHDGTVIRTFDESGPFTRVILPGNVAGWVLSKGIRELGED